MQIKSHKGKRPEKRPLTQEENKDTIKGRQKVRRCKETLETSIKCLKNLKKSHTLINHLIKRKNILSSDQCNQILDHIKNLEIEEATDKRYVDLAWKIIERKSNLINGNINEPTPQDMPKPQKIQINNTNKERETTWKIPRLSDMENPPKFERTDKFIYNISNLPEDSQLRRKLERNCKTALKIINEETITYRDINNAIQHIRTAIESHKTFYKRKATKLYRNLKRRNPDTEITILYNTKLMIKWRYKNTEKEINRIQEKVTEKEKIYKDEALTAYGRRWARKILEDILTSSTPIAYMHDTIHDSKYHTKRRRNSY